MVYYSEEVCKIFRGLSDIRGCSVGFKKKKLLFCN